MKLLVIGGVAGGATAAAKAARVDSSSEIILFERGDYVSFANCGLPYHVGNVIKNRESLLVMTPEALNARTGIDVRINSEVLSLDPSAKEVKVKNRVSGEEYSETYDKLIISTGSAPFRPPIPGADDPGVMSLWTIPDMDKIKERIDGGAKKAVVIGGGFIGIEIAENFALRGVDTSLVELSPQVLPPLDKEMAQPLAESMAQNGVKLFLDNGVTGIAKSEGASPFVLSLKSGETLEADFVVMSVGVRPNSQLAKDAGLDLGERGGIKVNEFLQTSNPDIYAVGDVIEVNNLVLNKPAMIPLAGPANRQGRIAAQNVFGAKEIYKGSQGTFVCKVFEQTVAATGASEKQLLLENAEYLKTYVVSHSHASYYPGAAPMTMKLLFRKDGEILGAQIVGTDGVDKRVDVLSTAIRNNMKVQDLEELELAYAPPYGSAKDPVNFLGFVAHNIIKGDSEIVFSDSIPEDAFLLDVREPDEVAAGAIPGAENIPLGELKNKMELIPSDKLTVAYCKVGLRGYLAERLLKNNGFKNIKNLSGGYTVWKLFHPSPLPQPPNGGQLSVLSSAFSNNKSPEPEGDLIELDACGLQCPGPIVKVKNKLDEMKDGETLKVTASDAGFFNDLPAWCQSTGNKLLSIEKNDAGNIVAVVSKGDAALPQVGQGAPPPSAINKKTAIVLFSNDLDKAMAAFIIATGFASLGHDVSIFFTFWGLNVLRKDNPPAVKKDFLSRMFGMMMPRGAKKLALSKMHMMGAGTAMMKHVMNSKNVDSLPALMGQARLMGVKFLACEMAMNVMGIKMEELIDGVESAGVANFAALAEKSGTTLFI